MSESDHLEFVIWWIFISRQQFAQRVRWEGLSCCPASKLGHPPPMHPAHQRFVAHVASLQRPVVFRELVRATLIQELYTYIFLRGPFWDWVFAFASTKHTSGLGRSLGDRLLLAVDPAVGRCYERLKILPPRPSGKSNMFIKFSDSPCFHNCPQGCLRVLSLP